jgi:hypothetical protein
MRDRPGPPGRPSRLLRYAVLHPAGALALLVTVPALIRPGVTPGPRCDARRPAGRPSARLPARPGKGKRPAPARPGLALAGSGIWCPAGHPPGR